MLPALAVAESLRKLGAEVTFASNADSRLVRDAGYELDVFGVEGFPREVSVRLAKALGRAATAVPACVRILRRRRPDVVLGGGGYVAGPMVLAAGSMRIPAALSEADAHLGLANRLAAPFAKVVFLAYPVEGLEPPKYQVVGRPIPARSQPGDPVEARRRFELPEKGAVVLVFGGSQGAQRLNEAALEAFGNSGPAVLHLAGERDYPALAERVARREYRLLPFTDDFGAALAAADLVVARAGGSGLGDRGRRPAGAARPVPARDRRPPGRERPLLRAGWRRRRRAGAGARPATAGRGASRRPGAPAEDG